MAKLAEREASLLQNQASLVQNQATFVQNQASFLARLSESDRLSSERFARIEADIGIILRVLADHGRMLQALPEAVRDKIGFKTE